MPEAQDLVRRADALAVRMARMAGGEIGRLSVGFGLSSIDLTPRLVAAFRRSRPDAYVTLEDMSSQEQLDRLRADELDVGFVRLPDEDGWGRLILGTDRLALASADHGDPPPPDPADISRWVDRRDFVQLVTARGPGLARQINRFCTAVGARPRIFQEAHDLQTVLALVAAGSDAAFVPASAARIAPSPIMITPLRHPAAEWRIAAVWNPGHLPPLVASFLDLVRDGSAR